MPSDAEHPETQPREEDFMRLFLSHQRTLYQHVVLLVGNTTDADDVFQELSLALWEQFDSFEPGTNFAAWARQVAIYRIKKFWARKKRSVPLLSADVGEMLAEESSDVNDSALAARQQTLRDCIDRLRLKDRQLLRQRYYDQRSVGGLAEQLGRPANSISKSLGRIRRTLSECLKRSSLASQSVL